MSTFDEIWGPVEKSDSEKSFDEYEFEKEDEDEGHLEEKQELKAEIGAKDRTSYNDACSSGTYSIAKGSSVLDIQKNMMKEIPEPLVRFKTIVGAVSHRLTEDDIFMFDNTDREILCTMADEIEGVIYDIKYLNPTAYLLGYVAINKQNYISKKIIQKIFKSLPKIGDTSITQADVCRYSRFWLKPDIQNKLQRML